MEKQDNNFDVVKSYLKQWQEIAELLKKQFTYVIKYQETFHKFVQPIITEQELQKRLSQSIQRYKASFPYISHITNSVIKQLKKNFQEFPPRAQKFFLLLGTHGWYIDLEMPLPDLWKLEKALSEGGSKEIEEALVEYFESRVDDIEVSIIKKFPQRRKVIGAAFKAHRMGEYELSIPVLLAQTDGICKDVAKQYLFMKQNRKPRTAIYVEQMASNAYMAAILSPLSHTLPIGASEHERPENFNELNRHMVLHGETLDYGTKTNSLKAISLINYVVHVLTLGEKKR